MAVSNAKSASTTDYTTASSILESLTDSADVGHLSDLYSDFNLCYVQVARIQMEVFNHVSTLEGYEAAAEDLNARLYDVNEVLFVP